MNKFTKRMLLMSFSAAMAAASCVNPEYDLDNIKVDKIHALDNIALPVGSTKQICLHDVMGNLEFNDYLKTDDNGNYYFCLLEGQISESVEIPDFVLDGYEGNVNQTTINYPVTIPELSPGLKFGPVELTKIKYDIEIDQRDLPEMISEIVYADVKTNLIVEFGYDINDFPFNNIYVQKGLKLVFPEWIILGEVPSYFEVQDNVLTTKDDILISAASGKEIRIPLSGLDFKKMPEGQGLIEKGHMYVNAAVEMSGSIYILSDDCTATGLFYPIIDTYLHVDPMTVEYVEAKVDLTDCASMEASFSLEDVAKDIGTEEYTLDFDDLKLNLEISNSLPFGMNFRGDAMAYRGVETAPVWQEQITVTDIPAGSEEHPASHSCTFELERFPFSPLPDRVDFRISPVDNDQNLIVVRPDTKYGVGVAYSLTADSFGRDFCIRVDADINGLGLEISEVQVAEAQVKFNLVNALPLDFELSAQAIDKDGNILEHVTLEMEGSIKGGSLQSPAKNPVTLKFSSKGHLSLDGVHLVMTTNVAGEKAVLNRDQYIQLTDISICLPKGVTYDFSLNE